MLAPSSLLRTGLGAGLILGSDLTGLGGHQTTAAGAANGSLMSGRRSPPSDHLLMIAATLGPAVPAVPEQH
jgi:hypothetical protein